LATPYSITGFRQKSIPGLRRGKRQKGAGDHFSIEGKKIILRVKKKTHPIRECSRGGPTGKGKRNTFILVFLTPFRNREKPDREKK